MKYRYQYFLDFGVFLQPASLASARKLITTTLGTGQGSSHGLTGPTRHNCLIPELTSQPLRPLPSDRAGTLQLREFGPGYRCSRWYFSPISAPWLLIAAGVMSGGPVQPWKRALVFRRILQQHEMRFRSFFATAEKTFSPRWRFPCLLTTDRH